MCRVFNESLSHIFGYCPLVALWIEIPIWLKECSVKAELDLQTVLLCDLKCINTVAVSMILEKILTHTINFNTEQFTSDVLITQTDEMYKTQIDGKTFDWQMMIGCVINWWNQLRYLTYLNVLWWRLTFLFLAITEGLHYNYFILLGLAL